MSSRDERSAIVFTSLLVLGGATRSRAVRDQVTL
jgi:hypothetical protein